MKKSYKKPKSREICLDLRCLISVSNNGLKSDGPITVGILSDTDEEYDEEFGAKERHSIWE